MNIKSLVCPYELKERPLTERSADERKHLFSDRLMVHKNGTVIETEANLKKFGDDRSWASSGM